MLGPFPGGSLGLLLHSRSRGHHVISRLAGAAAPVGVAGKRQRRHDAEQHRSSYPIDQRIGKHDLSHC
jgi:hypothetical protein